MSRDIQNKKGLTAQIVSNSNNNWYVVFIYFTVFFTLFMCGSAGAADRLGGMAKAKVQVSLEIPAYASLKDARVAAPSQKSICMASNDRSGMVIRTMHTGQTAEVKVNGKIHDLGRGASKAVYLSDMDSRCGQDIAQSGVDIKVIEGNQHGLIIEPQ